MSNEPKREDFMSSKQRNAMGDLQRTHENCIEKTGVARPGKTAHNRWKRARAQQASSE